MTMESILEAIVGSTSDAVVTADSQGQVITWNPAAERIFDYSEDEILGQPLSLIIPERHREAHDAGLSRVLHTGETKIIGQTAQLTGLRKGGDEFPIELSLATWVTDGTRFFSGIIRDVTDRKQAEQALREHEQLLESILDHMPAPVYLRDLEGRFMLINRAYEDILRVTKDSVRGKTLHEVFPKDLADDLQTLDPKIIKEGRVFEGEETHQLSDGKHVLAAAKFPIFDSSGEVVAVGGVDVDITELKRVEEALREAKRRSDEVSKLVAEKNRMLESLSNQLSKYLSPQVYASIFSGEQSVEISSKRKKLTVFFSDIVGFTETTDSLESEELTNLLNHYLTEMSKIALKHGATIDKYVGDAMMLFFGDPESRGTKEDAKACVEMAIAMLQRVRELQLEWRDRGLEKPFQIRIGINTGFCTVGNFGSEDRMDYTIIGNEVNLAARLESHAEVGGILLAHETYALVKDTVAAKEQKSLRVKGFSKPVRTYKVEGAYDELVKQGRVVRKEEEGIRILVDLDKQDKAVAIQVIEDFLSELKD